MAITGSLLCLYLLIHFGNNLTLLAGPGTFNHLVGNLESIKPFVRVIEVILLSIFLMHIFRGSQLSLDSRRAKPIRYQIDASGENSSIFSRTMGISGSIIFIFLVTHLSTFWYRFFFFKDHEAYYDIVVNGPVGFSNIFITILYLLAMVLLGFHLRHGFQSAIQTFGMKQTRIGKFIERVGFLFWFVIPLGFFGIAFWFGILGGGQV